MPPKRPALRRPAARARAPRRGAAEELARDQWLSTGEGALEYLKIGERMNLKMRYGGVAGEVTGEVMETTVDSLASWVGLDVHGTTIPALRHWVISRGGAASRLFCSRTPVEEDQQLMEEGLGYPTEMMLLTGDPRDGWARNCKDVEGGAPGQDENADLRALAGNLGYPQTAGEGVPPRGMKGGGAAAIEIDDSEEKAADLTTPAERSSKRRRVKEMIRKAHWDPAGTPLDPKYKREIKVSLRKRKKEGSSSATSSSESSGSYGGIGREQELKAVSRRLPGYLTRKAAQEGALSLSQGIGEDLKGFQIFLRYYRQADAQRGLQAHPPRSEEAPRGGPRRTADSGPPPSQRDDFSTVAGGSTGGPSEVAVVGDLRGGELPLVSGAMAPAGLRA